MTHHSHGPGAVIAGIIVVAALTGCGGTAAVKGAPSVTVAASATTAPGCAQATAAVLAARLRINARDYSGATTRISDLRDTLPRGSGKLVIDAALAATDLAFLSYDAASGNPAYQAIKDVYAGLDKIDADCAQSAGANGSA